MKTSRTNMDIVYKRKVILEFLDAFLRENIQDEDYFMYWLQEGVPDEYSEEDLDFIANYEDSYNDIVKTFTKLCRLP